MPRRQLPQLSGPRVPQEIIDKAARLTRELRPLGQPRVRQEDVIGALIDAATTESVLAALQAYNPKLGSARYGKVWYREG